VSPRRLGAAAALLAAVFVGCHALGLREEVSVLSGTSPGSEAAAICGIAYVVAWMGAVVVAPILALAALIQGAIGRVRRGRPAPPSPARRAP